MMRAARQREAARAADRDPGAWGVAPDIQRLTANDNVDLRRGAGSKVIRARRLSNAFDALYAGGGLSDAEYAASQRYWGDWCAAAGIVDADSWRMEMVDGKGQADGVTQGMIDASKRLAKAHREVGRASAMLLNAVTEPLIMRGELRVWRVLVAQVTGESERHAQAGAVRQALENLRLAYDDIDKEEARRRKSAKTESGDAA